MRFLVFLSLLIILLSSCINSVPRSRKIDDEDQVDKDKFELVSSTPAQGSSGILKNTMIVLTFNNKLRHSTHYSFKLQTKCDDIWHVKVMRDAGTDSSCVLPLPLGGGGSQLSEDGKKLTLKFSEEFKENSSYIISLHRDLMSDNGIFLGQDLEIRFSTKIEPLRYVDRVMSSDPSTLVQVIFNKSVDPATVVTNDTDSCSGAEEKRGIHLKCGEKCIPMHHPTPNKENTIFTLEPQAPLPFNTSCKLLIFASHITDLDGKNLAKDLEIEVPTISGFMISGKLTYGPVLIEDNHLLPDMVATPRATPPVKIALYRDGSFAGDVTCSYIKNHGCLYSFKDLRKGSYAVRILLSSISGGGSISVRDNMSIAPIKTYEYREDISTEEIEMNRVQDIHFVDANPTGKAFAILDTLWQLHNELASSDQFFTHAYWNSQNIAVAPAQVDLSKGYLPSTFARWTVEGHHSMAQLYILGDRRIDSDEHDRQVLAREWSRLFLDKKMRLYSGGFGADYGEVAQNPRVAFYEGLLNSIGPIVFGNSRYCDSGGSEVSDNGSGWDKDYSAVESKFDLWANSSELTKFFYTLNRLLVSPDPLLTLIPTALEINSGFSDLFSFLTGLKGLISAQQISLVNGLATQFSFDFDKAFAGDEAHCLVTEDIFSCSSYQLILGEALNLKMKAYSSSEQLGYIGNSSLVKFSVDAGKWFTVTAESPQRVNINLYAMTLGVPRLVVTTMGAPSSAVRFKAQEKTDYIALVEGIEGEMILDNQVTFSVILDLEQEENSQNSDRGETIRRLALSSGKATLVGDISFARKVGSSKTVVKFSPIFEQLTSVKVKFLGLDGIRVSTVNGTDSHIFDKVFVDGQVDVVTQGASGKLVVYVEGWLNGDFRSKSVTFIL